jgi:hypothetical protein
MFRSIVRAIMKQLRIGRLCAAERAMSSPGKLNLFTFRVTQENDLRAQSTIPSRDRE